MQSKAQEQRRLAAIVLLGFVLRVAFVLKGATIYYGAGQEHYNGDTHSFIQSFLNLWHTGHYTIDPLLPEASFGRLPGYPFFYGLHYIIFGPALAIKASVTSQVLLDTSVIVLLYKASRRWASKGPAQIVALLYATYPFAILWVTVIGSETLSVFCAVLWFNLITKTRNDKKHYCLIGALIALAFYVREYLGILLPISVLLVVIRGLGSGAAMWQRSACMILGFGALYMWWPARNYLNHNEIVLLKPASAGYINLREDMQAYLDWLACWTNDNSSWMESMLHNQPYRYPASIFSSPAEERRAYELTTLAANCGSSFQVRRLSSAGSQLPLPYSAPCNARIAQGFDSLRRSFIAHNPVAYYTKVPFANLRKAFFKSATINQGDSYRPYIHRILFFYRSCLLLFTVASLIIYRNREYLWPIIGYAAFVYCYMSLVFRSLEMRYLLQADVLMLVPAALLISQVLKQALDSEVLGKAHK
ncbi:glycosyltransferase family 39 protein [Hymenobacter puniceus]|uniref:glycosyltransferase family 39 protein n=1 Tax=Hymenobacter sp. BT190 TaxID=2763505 RepID=UPI001650D7E5|nr:glycosyltransferase family 39 protein [Hymenobacter sp. BT190]MBC6697785.1 glycosyltransferase family 39 protein [Hymenobacter sp. BT190]